MAENEANPGQAASAALTFADVPLKTPKMTASPSTGLDDGDNVTVTGKGFKRHEYIALTECVAGDTQEGECGYDSGIGNTVQVEANGSGRFSVTYNVARLTTLFGGTIDCAQAPGCVIAAVQLSGFESVQAVTPISFDPSAPVLPPLNLAVQINPTAIIVPSGAKKDAVEITGTMTCDRSTPVPVELELQVTEPVGSHEAGGYAAATPSCATGGTPFTVEVSSIHAHGIKPFLPGTAGMLESVIANSGSSSVDTTSTDSIKLLAPPST
jgi:hypothetical protein